MWKEVVKFFGARIATGVIEIADFTIILYWSEAELIWSGRLRC